MSKVTELSSFIDPAIAAESVAKLQAELNNIFLEREDEIRCMTVALVAEEHLLLLGPPGTAKSMLSKMLATALDGSFFELLFSKFSTPEDVYGPVSLKALENDQFKRVLRGRAADCDIFFADEIFKANDAILNAQLTLLNERQFDQDGQRIDVPLQMCIGASNELPQSDCLAALYDRFVLRRWVSYISDDDNFESLLTMKGTPSLTSRFTKDELQTLRVAREQVDISGVVEAFKELRAKLGSAHSISVSDRRWRKAVKLVRSVAVIDGRTAATPEDMLILADCLWDKPEDRPIIFTEIAELISPDLKEAMGLRDSALEMFAGIDLESLDPNVAAPVNNELKKIYTRIVALPSTPAIDRLRDEVREMQKRLGRAIADALNI